MPRKTKKQKIQSYLRRNQEDVNIKQPKEQSQATVDTFGKEFILKDLRKTFILSTLATLVELVLYLRLR